MDWAAAPCATNNPRTIAATDLAPNKTRVILNSLNVNPQLLQGFIGSASKLLPFAHAIICALLSSTGDNDDP